VNTVNSLSDRVGIHADTIAGATRVYTDDFGSTSSIFVSSNQPLTGGSSGFAHTADAGVDVEVLSGSDFFIGSGNTVELSHGAAKGLTFRVPPDEANPMLTLVGDLGQIEVIENPFDPRVEIQANPPRIQAKPLLDGTAGRFLTANNYAVQPIRAAATTMTSTYAIAVAIAGERATVNAPTAQQFRLASPEILDINGITIELPANSTQEQVINSVNHLAMTTGVFADYGPGGVTRFYSDEFGSKANITVVSNLAATEWSTGVGTTLRSDNGVDVEATVDANTYTGEGNIVRPTGGAEEGLFFSVLPEATDPVRTHTGALGIIHLKESPLSFPVGKDETVDVSLPDVHPRVYQLQEVSVRTQSDLNDSFSLVDEAISGISFELGKIEAMLDAVPLAAGIVDIGSDSGARFISEDGYIVKLNENDIVGPESIFDESGIIDGSGLYPNSWDVGEGYLGFAVPDENNFRFGWMRIEVGENASMIVKDFAIETSTGVPIWIGGTNRALPLVGDFDNDGTVGLSDFLQFSKVFGTKQTLIGSQNSDFDTSGTIDFADFLHFATKIRSTEVATVPEPQNCVMLVADISVSALRIRRQPNSTYQLHYIRTSPPA